MEEISTNQRCPNFSGILQTPKSGEETDNRHRSYIKRIKLEVLDIWGKTIDNGGCRRNIL